MWGFITVLNDILIPYLKSVFDLSYLEAMLVQFAFFGAYFIDFVYFLISMISGYPIIQGAVADVVGVQMSFFVPMLSYIYLAYYGWKGHIQH